MYNIDVRVTYRVHHYTRVVQLCFVDTIFAPTKTYTYAYMRDRTDNCLQRTPASSIDRFTLQYYDL